VPPTNRLGIAVLSTDVPETQGVQVPNSQIACAPIDATGCRYQLGCKKRQVYSPAVTAVQHAEKRITWMPLSVVEFGELLLYRYSSSNQLAREISARLLKTKDA